MLRNSKLLQPIQKDHELICRNCGCVVGEITSNNELEHSSQILSPDLFLLGSAIENNVKYSFRKSPQQVYEERVWKQLISITKEYALPDSIAFDTFNELKRKKRGFQSKTYPIKQLIQILSKDDNYIFIHKMRAIKARYESIIAG